jgi:hypothetical protein
MSKKKNDKKIIIFQPAFQDILVCRDPKKRPNMEIFVAEPENIYQENLGKIAGIFEIVDDSEDSSYVVNYLISVIKKEYFSRPKRGAIESFEAALHRANLALSKLASHGNVSWIGHLNAVCMVIEKNNLHISQTGTASVLLLRSGMLTNISEGGESIPESTNPLKTFQDVLSGRMEDNDKIILATDSIFEIFSLEEIKKSALKFSRSDFIQFLNTALINELEKASVLIVDISEKEEEEEAPAPRKSADINAFSQSSFQRTAPAQEQDVQKKQEEKREIIEEIKEEFKKTQDGFVDEKTGHIYIKDKDSTYESQYSKLEYISASKEKLVGAGNGFISSIKSKSHSFLERLKSRPISASDPEKIVQPEMAPPESEEISGSVPIVIKEEKTEKSLSIKENVVPLISKFGQSAKKAGLAAKNVFLQKIFFPAWEGIKKFSAFVALKIKSRREKQPAMETARPEAEPIYKDRDDFWKKRTYYLENQPSRERFSLAKIFLPSFSKLKNIIVALSLTQKIHAIILVLAIIFVPLFIVRYEKSSKEEKTVAVQEPPQSIALPLEQDVNVTRIESLTSAYQGTSVLSVININGKNFAVEKDKIASLADSKKYPLSSEFQNADLVSQMDDLNFIFVIKNKKIISLSATAGKFQDNNISMPDGAVIASARSYLTYLYLLDTKNSQIYRYPRAEGGFGEKTNWLKGAADFSGAKDMAINDNIYVTDGKEISKFFQGKKQDYSIEKTATSLSIDKLYTKTGSENLYVLDKTNSRILKLDKDGKILAQYYNSEIGSANDFAVDEENNTVYVSNENGVKSFGIE